MPKRTRPAAFDPDRLLAALAVRWPVAKGSLAEVRKPCVRPGCAACAEGRKHPAFIFSFREAGRQRCMHVPRALVPALREAIANGRRLETWLAAQGPALIRAYRAQRGPRGASPGGART